MDEFSESDFLDEDIAPLQEVSWSAPEFEYHPKGAGWYLLTVVIVLAGAGVAVLTKQWISIGVIAAMAIAIVVYAARKPRELEYHLDATGVTIEQRRLSFAQFESFAVIHHEKWQEIDLDPIRRFMPRITMPIIAQQEDEIVATLAAHLPQVDREPDLIERVTRRLKF